MELATASPYSTTVDFLALAKQDASFNKIWQAGKRKLDFSDPETVLALSKAILKTDFGLQLEVPEDRLCPTIPNRWNYVAWLHGLLDSTSPDYSGKYDEEREVVGLDIGSGASAIYSMLCLRARPKWHMCATDIDKKSFEAGARNLALNGLMTRTTLLQTAKGQPLIPLAALGKSTLDFTVCNPPFFDSPGEMTASLEGEGKTTKPNAVCTGAEVEMVCPGGDLGFVTQIVEESLVLREKVQWYSSMFGKLDSAKAIITLLKSYGITNWAVGIIDTGSSTKRWIVAWSFMDLRPRNSSARIDAIAHEYLPFPTIHKIPLLDAVDVLKAHKAIDAELSALDLSWSWDRKASVGIGEAAQDVWSRTYRRAQMRKAKERQDENENAAEHLMLEDDTTKGQEKVDDAQEHIITDTTMTLVDAAADQAQDNETRVQLAFRIRVSETSRYVELEWLRGMDQILWESFCGYMRTQSRKW